ncbi:SHD1 domain-containing protein [Pontiellaceae bacterium B12227]|nr:SHD1 domain-containing protein [Pontiellaceae bacterium B12227]
MSFMGTLAVRTTTCGGAGVNKGIVFILGISVLPVFGEFRIWEDTKGKSIEAEYVAEQAGKVVLKLRNGKTIRVNPATLSTQDREYANLQVPPKLVVDIDKEEVRQTDKNMIFAWYNEVRLTADIQKKSSRPYKGELTATFIFIGDNERSSHETLVKKEAIRFTIEKEKELRRSAQFSPKGNTLIKTAHHSFEGYALIITDPFGRIVATKSQPSSYARYAEKLLALNEGAEFDKTFSSVDLDSAKTERAEVAEPKTWLYGMGRGDFGFPQKSPDGIIARIQTRNKEAFLIHLREPFELSKMKKRPKQKSVNAVVTFKLTAGKIGLNGSNGNKMRLAVHDEEIHVLEIIGSSSSNNHRFVLDGTPVENPEIEKGSKPADSWSFAVEVDKKSRLEITSLDYQ